jgi:hypothetical protein
MAKNCSHQAFDTKCKVTYLANVDRYILEVALRCAEPSCRRVFLFQGIPGKPSDQVNLDGACTSPTGIIGKFSVYPENATLAPVADAKLLFHAAGGPIPPAYPLEPDIQDAEEVEP